MSYQEIIEKLKELYSNYYFYYKNSTYADAPLQVQEGRNERSGLNFFSCAAYRWYITDFDGATCRNAEGFGGFVFEIKYDDKGRISSVSLNLPGEEGQNCEFPYVYIPGLSGGNELNINEEADSRVLNALQKFEGNLAGIKEYTEELEKQEIAANYPELEIEEIGKSLA